MRSLCSIYLLNAQFLYIRSLRLSPCTSSVAIITSIVTTCIVFMVLLVAVVMVVVAIVRVVIAVIVGMAWCWKR